MSERECSSGDNITYITQLPTHNLLLATIPIPVNSSNPDDPRATQLVPLYCTSHGACSFLPSIIPTYQAKHGATPGVSRSERSQTLGRSLSAAGSAVDIFSTAISTSGVLLQLGTAGIAGPVGPDDAIAHLTYYILDPLENFVSWVGTGFTFAADFASGSSNINFLSREVIIGQDSTVMFTAGQIGQIAGVVPVAGPSLDTAVNLAVNAYDIGRLSRNIPTIMEIRWDSTGPYAILYIQFD